GSFRDHISLSSPFFPSWGLTTASRLNDAESCRDMMLNLATTAIRVQQNRLKDHQALQLAWFELGYGILRLHGALSEDHKALQQTHLCCAGKEAALSEQLGAVDNEKEDLLDKHKSQEENLKQLEESLAAKNAEWNSGDDQLRLSWMIYPVVLADVVEGVRDTIGFEYWVASSSGWTKSPVLWVEIEESSMTGLKLVQETTDKVVLVKGKALSGERSSKELC
ncbi:hypothetical protein Tco_1453606, partial [Tanacetum coccineum]